MQEVITWTHLFHPSDIQRCVFCCTENLCRLLLRLVMRNPDVLLGCRWMSSAVHDTAAGFSAQTEKQRLGARRSAPSPCHLSIHLYPPPSTFVPLLLHPYLLLSVFAPLILWSAQGDEVALTSHTGNQGACGSRLQKVCPIPSLTLVLPFSCTHTHTHNLQSAWWTIHVKCQITDYTRESLGFKESNALLISVKPNTVVNE